MTAEDPGSVTEWLPRFEAGDPEAVRFVWNRYFEMMVLLARLKLAGLQDRGRDAEDVALSAFNALCRAKGRTLTPCLRDRDELWTLLARSTRNRVLNLRRDAARQKR
jgi:DNA-directed RNA polymerase specialized sigma24 family protein